MNSAHDHVFDRADRPPTPLTSWYAQGISDALGDRLLMFDNTAAGSLELLRFRPELAAAPGFERALRERVERLSTFTHHGFSQVRTVQRLDEDDGLTLVSTHIPGKRLREVFARAQPRGPMHPAFAAFVIRHLAPALADLHARGDDLAHGALSADRIVLTPEGRLVIVEHVLGSAIERLQLPQNRLWSDLGIICRSSLDGRPKLDRQSDVVQLGVVALSLLLGRRVTPDDYPRNLGLLLDEITDTAGRRSPSLAPKLRKWLERALHVRGGFDSALEAADDLGDVPEIGAFPETRMSDVALTSHTVTALSIESPPDQHGTAIALDLRPPDRVAVEPPTREHIVEPGETGRAVVAPTKPRRRRVFNGRNLAVAFAVIALVEAATIGRLVAIGSPPPITVATMPVHIEPPPAGDIITVDGHEVGAAPLQLSVGSVHSVRVIHREDAQTGAPVSIALASAVESPTNVPELTPGRPHSGGLKLSSPIELHVLEGERVLGSSADGPIVTSAGIHQLEFVNSALGYRARQTVEIKAGQIVPLTVRPPDGRVSINASPWAQIWIDGNPVGETPLANLAVPVGEHEIVFRHPQLGERRETTIVQSGALTRVTATLGR